MWAWVRATVAVAVTMKPSSYAQTTLNRQHTAEIQGLQSRQRLKYRHESFATPILIQLIVCVHMGSHENKRYDVALRTD